MKKKEIIGVDVSKETLDLHFNYGGSFLQISNNKSGYKEFDKYLSQLSIDPAEVLLVMEHTGMYSYLFEKHLKEKGVNFSKVSALEIIRSAGLTRGKSDKTDARMIAQYGAKHTDKISVTDISEHNYHLKALLGLREKLVSQKAGYTASLNEQKKFMTSLKSSSLIKSQQLMMRTLEREIKKVENEIREILESDESTKKNVELLTSVVGIGFVIAASMIMWTDNFNKFTDARKFACYSGIAPFEYSSGTSIKKRTKVSQLANKRAKALLDLGAKSAIIHDPEINQFYNRRIKEGKNTRSTRNIIRNKLVYRMFAVIKRQEPYVKNHVYKAA
jgi:transposase